MVRLKYTKNKDNYSETSQDILIGTEYVRIIIHPFRGQYLIWSINEANILDIGKAKTIRALKAKAKKSLKLLGAKFFDEIRKK